MQIRLLAQSAVFPATGREAFDIAEKSKVQPAATLVIFTFWLCGCGLLSGGCYSHVIIHIPYMPETWSQISFLMCHTFAVSKLKIRSITQGIPVE